MGFFSFTTSDGKPIRNKNAGGPAQTIYMVLPDGSRYKEEDYAGYGVFGGKDFFVTLAEINNAKGDEEAKRSVGIAMFFDTIHGRAAHQLPRFSTMPNKYWEELNDPDYHTDQGASGHA